MNELSLPSVLCIRNGTDKEEEIVFSPLRVIFPFSKKQETLKEREHLALMGYLLTLSNFKLSNALYFFCRFLN